MRKNNKTRDKDTTFCLEQSSHIYLRLVVKSIATFELSNSRFGFVRTLDRT